MEKSKYKEVYLQKRIIVVGAGIAGLACANRLRQLGYENVKVLEARDRVGGRIHGIDLGPSNLELGAQWIHGQQNNVVYNVADGLGIIHKNAPSYMTALKRFINLTQFERESLAKLFGFLNDQLKSLSEDILPGTSVLSYLDDIFTSYIDSYDSFGEAYEWFCKFLMELNGCDNLSLLSLKMINNYKECEGEAHVELKGGYSRLLDILVTIIPPDSILKNKSVIKIDWSDFKPVAGDYRKDYRNIKVYCEDGETFIADHVVITIPLGCLKEHSQSMFYPTLSPYKELAIHCLGFGTVNKIFFHFEEPFWKESDVYIVFQRHLKDTELLTKDSKKCKTPLKFWTKSINRFSYVLGAPKVLCAWVAGEGAVLMESLPEAEVIEDCIYILENILEKKLPMPNKMIRSSWFSDSYARGSYSHISIECETEGMLPSHLAVPEYAESYCFEHPILSFAGEATHDDFYSSVHGAYESGIREAEKLFHHYSYRHIVEKEDEQSLMQLNKKPVRNELQIVIVGAGIAGLACALHLANRNFNNILIVDAQDKIGGRVLSVDYNGDFLELGAQWIHGTDNALYDFSRTHKLLPSLLENVNEGKGLFCTSDGQVIHSSIVEEVGNVVKDAKLRIDNEEYDRNIKKSVKSFLSDAFNSYASESSDKTKISLKKAIFEWYMNFEVIDNACDDLNNVAIQSFTQWDDCPEELYHIKFQNGFKSVVDTLLSQIPDVEIRLNTAVKTIKWDEDFQYLGANVQNRFDYNFPVVLECNNKTTIFADSVIVTASVGFLQENIHTFFLPPLPPHILKAFSTIGFGTVNKIFLIYDEPFWNPDDLGFHFVWTSDGDGKCKQLCIENPWVLGITGFDVMKQYPNVLLGWIGGNEARLMEGIKEEHVSNVCTELLRIFLDNPDIPNPTKILRSCWYSNPYVRGSYSNRSPDFYDNELTLRDIQEPLCCSFFTRKREFQWPILLFSGEATDENSFSSAHGAYNSGIKAAENIIKTCTEIEVAVEQATTEARAAAETGTSAATGAAY